MPCCHLLARALYSRLALWHNSRKVRSIEEGRLGELDFDRDSTVTPVNPKQQRETQEMKIRLR